MSQVPTTEVARLLQLAARTGGTSTAADRFPVGQVIQAEVLRALGDSLFSLSVRGSTLTASSDLPLQVGDQLNLEVGRDEVGTLTLRILTNTNTTSNSQGVPAQAASSLSSETLAKAVPVPTQQPGQAASPSTQKLIGSTDVNEISDTGASVKSDALAKLDGLVRPGGAIEQLVTQRPDLAPRVETLLKQFVDRPSGLGSGIEELGKQIENLVAENPTSGARASISQTSQRLADQLFGESALSDPKRFAGELASRLSSLARGLEGVIAKATASVSTSTPAPPTAQPAPAANSAQIEPPPATGNISAEPARAAATNVSEAPRAVSSNGEAATVVPTAPISAALKAQAAANLLAEVSSIEVEPAPADVAPVPKGVPISSSEQLATAPTSRVDSAPSLNSPATVSNHSESVPIDTSGPSTAAPSTHHAAAATSSTTDATDSGARPSPAVVHGSFDGDLKGQLLELRSQLQSLATQQPESSTAIQQAIQRTDMLLDQVAGQQLRNVDGLNQYAHVELPVDPKTGIQEARLQVFYRQRGNKNAFTPQDDDRFTVAVFLHLTQLGDVLATITGVEGTVSVNFTVGSSASKEWLGTYVDELRKGLVDAGHQGAMITVREMAPPGASKETEPSADEVWDEFLDQTPTSTDSGYRLDKEA